MGCGAGIGLGWAVCKTNALSCYFPGTLLACFFRFICFMSVFPLFLAYLKAGILICFIITEYSASRITIIFLSEKNEFCSHLESLKDL